MIVQRTMSRMLSGGSLLALAAFLLPVIPAWAQQPPAEPIRFRVVGEEDAVKVRAKDVEIERLTAELAKKKAEIAALEAKLKAIQGGKAAAGATEKPGVIVLQLGTDKGLPGKPGEQPKIVLELKDLQFQVDPKAKPEAAKDMKAEVELELRKRLESVLRERVQNQEHPLVIEVTIDGKKKVIELPAGSRVIDPTRVPPTPPAVPAPPAPPAVREPKSREGAVAPPAVRETKPREGAVAPPATIEEPRRVRVATPAAPSDTDKRVGELEKKMAEIMRELEGLRKDLKAAPPKPPVRYIPLPEREERKESPW